MKSVIAIFGATGNLMYKKLIPALSALSAKNLLDPDTIILCIGRANHTKQSYLETAKSQVQTEVDWDKFASMSEYFRMDFDQIGSYDSLYRYISQFGQTKRLFYLAVAPELFPVIAQGISEVRLIEKNDEHGRIVFEKPFGEDLKTAKYINALLWKYFDESQIYRIDHYLGKEMIQNILVMRFANKLFENNWNSQSIEKVTIIAKETEGVMTRGNYYDHVGAIKDMIQSHLLQMAALIAMEVPKSFDEDGIREEKVRVLKRLHVHQNDIIRGQYIGYLEEKNIAKNSQTETAIMMKAYIDSPRWKGVPFYFLTGKKFNEKRSEIIVDFEDNTSQGDLWPEQKITKNQLVIRVAPDEGVSFRLNVKEHGLSTIIHPMEMDYCHDCNVVGNKPEAYERLLLDFIRGQSTLFTRWDEIEAAWKVIDSVKSHDTPLISYHNFEDFLKAIDQHYQEVTYDHS